MSDSPDRAPAGATARRPPAGTPIPRELLNRLQHGKIEPVLERLPEESVDCVFADPDYNIGVDYAGKSYKIADAAYQKWCAAWAEQCHAVLKPDGNMFIINYPRNNALLWANCLDPTFKRVNEYAWIYRSNLGVGKHQFTTAHRSILHCTKSRKNRFYKDAVVEPYRNPTDRRVSKLIASGSKGRMPYSWIGSDPPVEGLSWIEGIELEKNVNRSKSFHSCQIPERLSSLLFRATTKPGDTVLVLFGGAGSELVVCEKLGLNWVSAEPVEAYCDLIEKRLHNGGAVPKELRRTIPHRTAKQVTARRGTVTPLDAVD
jgi:site-specific DNA-methyltransferase (adenine-specific)